MFTLSTQKVGALDQKISYLSQHSTKSNHSLILEGSQLGIGWRLIGRELSRVWSAKGNSLKNNLNLMKRLPVRFVKFPSKFLDELWEVPYAFCFFLESTAYKREFLIIPSGKVVTFHQKSLPNCHF